ncbi:hypothetical protein [Spirulina sp. 06S082]|uniref:hypothetical protein n=1 Tax=Spirulina sp. 06S082 TaxID=3110248 RepID=UPI002B1FBDAD|nr:hypothetical protein [Spirulina sp. 06S082]MEA5468741.1 hypothetical protein [Spirulina sp. 06S082]
MAEITLDETRLKELLKAAIFELVEEQKDIFIELVSEVLEDVGMDNAIKAGENTEIVSREEIFEILNRKLLPSMRSPHFRKSSIL